MKEPLLRMSPLPAELVYRLLSSCFTKKLKNIALKINAIEPQFKVQLCHRLPLIFYKQASTLTLRIYRTIKTLRSEA